MLEPDSVAGQRGGWPLRRWLVPSLACLLWLIFFLRLTVTPYAPMLLSLDGDIALHVTLGEQMIEDRGLLSTEPTNYIAPGKPFLAHEWLAQIAYALSHRAFGLAGPVLVAALLASTLYVLLLWRIRSEGTGMWPALIVVLLAILVMTLHLHARPHVFGWLFAFVWLGLLERLRRGRITPWRWLGTSAVLMLVWANVHGGFLFGFLLLGLYGLAALVDVAAAESADRRAAWRRLAEMFGGGVALLLVSAVNPWGFGLHVHFLEFMGNPFLTSILTEFASPNFNLPGMWSLLVFIALAFILLAVPRPRPAPHEWLLVVALTALTLLSARNSAFLALLSAPILGRRLQILLDEGAERPTAFGRLAALVNRSSQRMGRTDARHGGLAVAAVVVVLVTWAIGVRGTPAVGFDPRLHPVTAVDWIAADPDRVQGRMFNPYGWGPYLAYRLYPEQLTFVNSWSDHLGEDAMRTFLKVQRMEDGWRDVLDEYEVGWVIYYAKDALTLALAEDPGWERVYQDDTAAVLVRRAP